MPDANGSSLHLGLATEGASVLGVLADFNFLHHFPEGGTITGPVFPDDPDLLGALSLWAEETNRPETFSDGNPVCARQHAAEHKLS